MREIVKRALVSVVATGLILSLFSACGTNTGTTTNPTSGNTGSNVAQQKVKITATGSTTVQPLLVDLAKAYMIKNPNVTIETSAGGSDVGIKAAVDGTADIGMSSSKLSEDNAKLLKQYSMAIDGVAIIVNPKNTVEKITQKQLADIYSGKVKNWKDVGGADKEIIAITREDGSGTRKFFEEHVLGKGDKALKAAKELEIISSTDKVLENVIASEGGIGYISVGHMNSKVKALSYEEVAPSMDNISNGTYKFQRPLLLVMKNEATGETKKFIDYIYSNEGKDIIKKGYVAVDKK